MKYYKLNDLSYITEFRQNSLKMFETGQHINVFRVKREKLLKKKNKYFITSINKI